MAAGDPIAVLLATGFDPRSYPQARGSDPETGLGGRHHVLVCPGSERTSHEGGTVIMPWYGGGDLFVTVTIAMQMAVVGDVRLIAGVGAVTTLDEDPAWIQSSPVSVTVPANLGDTLEVLLSIPASQGAGTASIAGNNYAKWIIARLGDTGGDTAAGHMDIVSAIATEA